MKTDPDFTRDMTRDFAVANKNTQSFNGKKPISRFIITSGLVHLITASAIVITNHVPPNEPEKDFVVIDVSAPSDSNGAPQEALLPEQNIKSEASSVIPPDEQVSSTPRTDEAQPLVAETPTTDSQEKKVAPLVIEKASAPKQAPAASKPSPPQPQASVMKEQHSPAVTKPDPIATVEDIETPTLDDSQTSVPVGKTQDDLKPEELDQDLGKIDEQYNQKLQAVKNELEENTSKAESSIAESTDSASEELRKQDELVAAQIKARTEEIHKEELARKDALEKAAADRLVPMKEQEGAGLKDAGPGHASTEVRALAQLRQMPGNPKPQYDSDERLRGDKGVVVFQAYVTQSGNLNEFKLQQSSGYRNLDAKTLKALKQWKFYPGQEGWVELPFNWNLKGGPQEMPAFLRRKSAKAP